MVSIFSSFKLFFRTLPLTRIRLLSSIVNGVRDLDAAVTAAAFVVVALCVASLTASILLAPKVEGRATCFEAMGFTRDHEVWRVWFFIHGDRLNLASLSVRVPGGYYTLSPVAEYNCSVNGVKRKLVLFAGSSSWRAFTVNGCFVEVSCSGGVLYGVRLGVNGSDAEFAYRGALVSVSAGGDARYPVGTAIGVGCFLAGLGYADIAAVNGNRVPMYVVSECVDKPVAMMLQINSSYAVLSLILPKRLHVKPGEIIEIDGYSVSGARVLEVKARVPSEVEVSPVVLELVR